jgi:hypothetical protein
MSLDLVKLLTRVWSLLRGGVPKTQPAGIVQPDTVDNACKLERAMRSEGSERIFFDAHVAMDGYVVHLVYGSVYYFENSAGFSTVEWPVRWGTSKAPNHPNLSKFLNQI